jgi:hypothetical protein
MQSTVQAMERAKEDAFALRGRCRGEGEYLVYHREHLFSRMA